MSVVVNIMVEQGMSVFFEVAEPSMGVTEGDVEAVGHQRCPARLVGGAAATPGFAMKELVEEEEVLPGWVVLVLLDGACVPKGDETLGETDGLRNT